SFQGSGSSGSPVLLDGTGATLNATLSLVGAYSFWTIQNVTWASSFSGSSPDPNAVVLRIDGAFNGLITRNMMDVNAVNDVIWLDQTNAGAVHDITISNNFIRNSANNLNIQEDLLATAGAYNITVTGNYFELRAQNGNQHDDEIQTFQGG